jgi:putative spermidine/putrescine transport system ATP-binding protein
MRAEIRRIHNALGATTIYVTHDQDEALSLADRIVVLRDGTIRQIGRPHELYEAPDDVDVAEFMGFRNRLDGRCVTSEDGVVRLQTEGAEVSGKARGTIAAGNSVVALFRAEDLTIGPDDAGGIRATVDAIEYRGREFVGLARTKSGTTLSFTSASATQVGSEVTLVVDPSHVLIFRS